MCFESANRLLGKLSSGTHSHCTTICRRYVEWRSLVQSELPQHPAAELIASWLEVPRKTDEQVAEKDVWETPAVQRSRSLYKGCTILSKIQVNGVHLESACYHRNLKAPNSYVLVKYRDEDLIGQILHFLFLPFECPDNATCAAVIKIFKVKESIELPAFSRRQWYLELETTFEDLLPVDSFRKVFFLETEKRIWAMPIPHFIDHT